MIETLSLQFRRLRGTLAIPLVLIAPALTAIVTIAIAIKAPEKEWSKLVLNSFALWTYFVLPLTIAALTALIAQIEHQARTWDHLLTLPVARTKLFVAMALAAVLMVGMMNLLLVAYVMIGGSLLAATIFVAAPSTFPLVEALAFGSMTWLASICVTILQLWVGIAFRNFVVSIILGLAGTFIVVASMGAPEAAFLPWGMPLGSLPTGKNSPVLALALGGLGGLLLLPLMLAHFSRKEF